MSILLLILGIVLFISLVVVHEWGHFIMARRNGVTVEEFGIFFPPRLFKHKTRGGWNFTINLLPLGGFVKLKGEHDTDTGKGTYGAASLVAKTKIMAAGVVMNFITAVLLLMITAWVGMPQLVNNQFTVKSDTKIIKSETLVSYVEPGSAAAKIGLKSTDHLESIGAPNGPAMTIKTPDELKAATKHFAGQKVVVHYSRGGQQHTGTATLLSNQAVAASQKTDNPKGQLGVVSVAYTLQRSTWSAPVVAVGLTGQFMALTFQGLGHALHGVGSIIAGAITGNAHARQNGQIATSNVHGPVGIYAILQDGSLLGYQFVLLVIAIISLTLAIMNILPVPPLDGGRLWWTLFARGIRKKPLTAAREELINGIGFAFFIALLLLITIVNDRHLF